MLALTDSAVEAVKAIVEASDDAVDTSGLRMVAEPTVLGTNLRLSVVPLPAEEDEVIEDQGARLFLEPDAASLLDERSWTRTSIRVS